jgi:hypothetical protein
MIQYLQCIERQENEEGINLCYYRCFLPPMALTIKNRGHLAFHGHTDSVLALDVSSCGGYLITHVKDTIVR